MEWWEGDDLLVCWWRQEQLSSWRKAMGNHLCFLVQEDLGTAKFIQIQCPSTRKLLWNRSRQRQRTVVEHQGKSCCECVCAAERQGQPGTASSSSCQQKGWRTDWQTMELLSATHRYTWGRQGDSPCCCCLGDVWKWYKSRIENRQSDSTALSWAQADNGSTVAAFVTGSKLTEL